MTKWTNILLRVASKSILFSLYFTTSVISIFFFRFYSSPCLTGTFCLIFFVFISTVKFLSPHVYKVVTDINFYSLGFSRIVFWQCQWTISIRVTDCYTPASCVRFPLQVIWLYWVTFPDKGLANQRVVPCLIKKILTKKTLPSFDSMIA